MQEDDIRLLLPPLSHFFPLFLSDEKGEKRDGQRETEGRFGCFCRGGEGGTAAALSLFPASFLFPAAFGCCLQSGGKCQRKEGKQAMKKKIGSSSTRNEGTKEEEGEATKTKTALLLLHSLVDGERRPSLPPAMGSYSYSSPSYSSPLSPLD